MIRLADKQEFTRSDSRARYFSKRHFNWIVFAALAIVILILYGPTLNAYFISDDFSFLSYLHFYTRDMLNGERWQEWFIGGIQGYAFFRPLANSFWVLNYVAFKIDPLGYHSVSLLFHLLASYLVFLLGKLLTHNRVSASMGAILFAAMPVHAEAVSWVAAVYDPISGVFFFLSFLFFILYQQQARRRWYVIAFVAFVAALCSKEIALTLPGMLLLYDVMFSGLVPFRIWERIKRHTPFWIIVGIRILAFGHGFRGLRLNEVDWWGWLNGLLVRVGNPLVTEFSVEMSLLLLLSGACVLLIFRSRLEVVYCMLWIPVTFVPTLVGEVSDRSFYISSFGLALALASLLTQPATRPRRWLSVCASAILALLILVYSVALVSSNEAIRHAGEVAETIPQQVIALHPTMSPNDRMIFVGVPDRVPEGPLVYLTGFPGPLHIYYGSREIQALKFAKFPILLDRLDHTYFFEVNHRTVVERTDLIQALKERAHCEDYSVPLLTWTFSESVHDWEPWNQLTDLAIRDSVLAMKSEGTDPIMASPPIDISAIAIGEIQITMRVRSAQPVLQGELYWLSSDQQDFSPVLKAAFQVQADGAWHIYSVEIAKSGMLAIGDHIAQIRLDPVDAPAEIAIQSITIFTHCSSLQGEHCMCAAQ